MATIALQMPRNSLLCPTHSLNPTGLPPDNSRSRAMNSTNPFGVENIRWAAGEITSWPIGTPRISAISRESFFAGRMPP